MKKRPTIAYNAHHSPMGAFASFTLGFPGAKGGLGIELPGPANENVYIGLESRSGGTFEALPFFEGSEDESKRFDVGAKTAGPTAALRAFKLSRITRHLSACVDSWHAGDLSFTVYSPVKSVPDPEKGTRRELQSALVPAVFAELTADNTRGKTTRRVFFGYRGGDPYSAMRMWGGATPFAGVGQGLRTAIVTDSQGAFPGLGFTAEKCLVPDRPENLDFGLGVTGLVMAEVLPGERKTLRFAICFHRSGITTSGMPCSYFYSRYFGSLESVATFALLDFERQKRLALAFDKKLEALPPDRRFQLAHAIRSHYGSTQFLEHKGRPLWIVNEGEFRMINTFDLTIDHLFFEMAMNPWVVKNHLDWFSDRYSYTDAVRLPGGETEYPGGISFTHDMGVANHFSRPKYSAYELFGLSDCFSHMTHEQLVNWVLCGVTYARATGDKAWLKRRMPVFRACLTSLLNRDHPVPGLRDGVMSADSSRCLGGTEITTYDSLDVSLGQARNNLYLAVKTWAAYLGLESILPEGAAKKTAARQAELCAGTIVANVQPGGFIPAVMGEKNKSRIIPAIEGLVFPEIWGMGEALSRNGPFARLIQALKTHLTTVLVPGTCLFPDGGWKLSSTNDNSWLSKIYLCQHVAESVLGFQPSARADAVHRSWLLHPENASFAWSDQMVAGIACGSKYYPRGVTAWLWLRPKRPA